VSQAPNGIGSASGEAAGNDGSLADATNTAAAAHAFGTADGNGGGVPTMNGNGTGTSAFASPLRTKPVGAAKPVSSGIKGSAERPRWGARTTPGEAQATRRGSGGRLSSNGSSPAPTTPPRRRTAGDAAGGSTIGAQNSTPEMQRTPSYMLATNSSKSKVFSTPPANRSSRNEGRRPYGLIEPRGDEEQV
jgi:hypothetical protein